MKHDNLELEQIKDAMDNTILQGQHFSEKHKRNIRGKISSYNSSRKRLFPTNIFGFSLSIIFIVVFSVFTFQLITSNLISHRENDVAESELIDEKNNNDNKNAGVTVQEPEVDQSESVIEEGPRTLASLSMGKSVKGTGNLVTEVVSVRKIPASEIQSSHEDGIIIGITVRLENRGKEDLEISPDKTMLLKNENDELQNRVKVDDVLNGTLSVGSNVTGEIVFDTRSYEKYFFYFVDLGGEDQTLWKFEQKDL